MLPLVETTLLNQPTEANQSARKGVGEMTAYQSLHKKVFLILFCRTKQDKVVTASIVAQKIQLDFTGNKFLIEKMHF